MTAIQQLASHASLILCVIIMINEWTKGFNTSKRRLLLSVILWHLVTISNLIEQDWLIAALFTLCSALALHKYRKFVEQEKLKNDNTDPTKQI